MKNIKNVDSVRFEELDNFNEIDYNIDESSYRRGKISSFSKQTIF